MDSITVFLAILFAITFFVFVILIGLVIYYMKKEKEGQLTAKQKWIVSLFFLK